MQRKSPEAKYHEEHSHRLKYKVCVSGAAETSHCAADALGKAELLGREIAKRGLVLVTGATTGIPYWSAKGAKAEGGIVIGFSPAASKAAHVKTYHLPLDYHDVIVYTGFEYAGRNLILTRSADAIITICGRLGSLNEFTVGFEDKKPMGVLEGSGGIADIVRGLVEGSHRGPGKIVYSSDPAELVDKLLKLIESEGEKNDTKGRVF